MRTFAPRRTCCSSGCSSSRTISTRRSAIPVETKLGDYEAAIGALERMLFYNPNLPRVKLELGVLYFRLHSYEMARSYFNAAIAGRTRRRTCATRSRRSSADRSNVSAASSLFAQTGLRYQTNANAGPNSPVVQALGQNALLSSQFQRTPDWNAFGLVTAHHFYDFGDQNSATAGNPT